MPHKTRYDRFMEFYTRHGIADKIGKKIEKRDKKGELVRDENRKIVLVCRFPETTDCFHPHSQEFYLPGIEYPAEYIHKLNLLVKPIREHALDCPRCANHLEALLLSQANPKLFTEALGKILAFESELDKTKHIYVAGLPYPHHETSSQTGRIVYVAPRLPLDYAVRDFLGRVIENFGDKIRFSKFAYREKHDGKRKPCHQASAHLIDYQGYISIRSRHRGSVNPEEITRFPGN